MKSTRTIDVLVLSEINPDLVLTGGESGEPVFGQVERLLAGAELTIGGSGTIFASGAARLGLRTVVVGLVGDDPFGAFITEQLRQHGVDTAGVVVSPSVPTGLTVILNRGEDRAILTHPGAMSAMTTDLVDASLVARARHIHVSSYFLQTGLQPGLPSLLRSFRAKGGTVSLDTNWDPAERWADGVHELLTDVDVILPNEAEACALAGTDDLEEAAAILARTVPQVVVKRGRRGAYAQFGNERITSPSIVVDVADTTGAGDSFDAGYVHSLLLDLAPLDRLRMAAVCGALSTRALGGTAAQATLEEALAATKMLSQPASHPC